MSTTVLKQTERQFEQAVRELAEAKGWLVAHFADARREVVNRRTGERKLVGDRGAKGFPDLVMARRGRIVFAELKAENGRLGKEQKEWLRALGSEDDGTMPLEDVLSASLGGCVPRVWVVCWRPSDWIEIEEVLR